MTFMARGASGKRSCGHLRCWPGGGSFEDFTISMVECWGNHAEAWRWTISSFDHPESKYKPDGWDSEIIKSLDIAWVSSSDVGHDLNLSSTIRIYCSPSWRDDIWIRRVDGFNAMIYDVPKMIDCLVGGLVAMDFIFPY